MKENRNWTGERLETFVNNRIAIEHIHRYALAKNYIENKIVLDIACGEGYGSNLMSEKASFVYGVDIDLETISKASCKYKKNNIKFLKGSTSDIPLEENSIDIVVSFETLEHHDKHDEMMVEIKRVLKPNGILIISSPDKLYYSDFRNYNNIFHKKELYKDEFINLLREYFKNILLLSQIHINGVSLILNEINQNALSLFSGNFNQINNKEKLPMFLIAIVSDDNFEKSAISIFDGLEMNNLTKKNEITKVKNSITFKVGKFILFPFRVLKKIFS